MQIAFCSWEKWNGRKKGSIGSSIIRCDWLINHWPEAHLWQNGRYSDVIVYQKVYWYYHALSFKGIKILDLCDPDWLNGAESQIKKMSLVVDAITTSTDALCKTVQNFVDIPVYYIPDRLDLNQFPIEKKKHVGRAKTVCWFGYMHNADFLLNTILPSIAKLGLSLTVISNKDFIPLNYYGVNITNIPYETDTAYSFIRQADIVLNPKSAEQNFRYKSNNKTLIAWALGIPVAETLDQLEKLMDADERNKEIELRSKEIKDKWSVEHSINEYKKIIEDIYAKRKIQN